MAHKHQYDFYIPQFDNNGQEFTDLVKERVRDDLIDCFGGLTVLPYADGYWRNDDGKLMIDEIKIHRVLVDCDALAHVKVQALHAKFRNLLKQDELFVIRSEVNIEELPMSSVERYNRGN